MKKIWEAMAICLVSGASMMAATSVAVAQTSVTSSITIQNQTFGNNAAAINTNGPNGGCSASSGNGSAMCSSKLSTSLKPNDYTLGTITFSPANAYNTLYLANITYYLDATDTAINSQSETNCSWQIKIIKQISLYGQPWQGTITFAGTQDTGTPLVPDCTITNFNVDTSTGQFTATLIFGGH